MGLHSKFSQQLMSQLKFMTLKDSNHPLILPEYGFQSPFRFSTRYKFFSPARNHPIQCVILPSLALCRSANSLSLQTHMTAQDMLAHLDEDVSQVTESHHAGSNEIRHYLLTHKSSFSNALY